MGCSLRRPIGGDQSPPTLVVKASSDDSASRMPENVHSAPAVLQTSPNVISAQQESVTNSSMTINRVGENRILVFLDHPLARCRDMMAGMVSELRENGWGRGALLHRVETDIKVDAILQQADLIVCFDYSVGSTSLDSIRMNRLTAQLAKARTLNVSIVTLYESLASAQGSVLNDFQSSGRDKGNQSHGVVFHMKGIQRANMWRAILAIPAARNEPEETSEDSTPFLARTTSFASMVSPFVAKDTLVRSPSAPSLASFPAIYIVAPQDWFEVEARTLAASLSMRGIYSRVLSDRDDISAISSNQEAVLVVFVTPTLFLDDPLASRAVRAFQKTNASGGRSSSAKVQNRLVNQRMIGYRLVTANEPRLGANSSSDPTALSPARAAHEDGSSSRAPSTPMRSSAAVTIESSAFATAAFSTPARALVAATEEPDSDAFDRQIRSSARQRGILSLPLWPSLSVRLPLDSMAVLNVITDSLLQLFAPSSASPHLKPDLNAHERPLALVRESLLDIHAVSDLENAALRSRVVVFTGPVQSGKSSVLAQLCVRTNPMLRELSFSSACAVPQQSSMVGAFYFFSAENTSVRMAIISIYAQLCGSIRGVASQWAVSSMVNTFDDLGADLCVFFFDLVGDVLHDLAGRRRDDKHIVVVLDGLEFCDRLGEVQRILKRFAYSSPDFVSFIVSTSDEAIAREIRSKADTFSAQQASPSPDGNAIELTPHSVNLMPESTLPPPSLVQVVSESEEGIRSRIATSLTAKYGLLEEESAILAENEGMHDPLERISARILKISRCIGNAYFAFLLLDEPYLRNLIKDISVVDIDEKDLRERSSMNSALSRFFAAWGKSFESEEIFQLAVLTSIVLPREPIPERIWSDLDLALDVPIVLRSTQGLKANFQAMQSFAREIVCPYSISRDSEAHALLAKCLSKSKWTSANTMSMGRRIVPSNALGMGEERSGRNETFVLQEAQDLNNDSSILDVAADVRRSFLGHELDAQQYEVEETNMVRRYRLVRRPTFNEFTIDETRHAFQHPSNDDGHQVGLASHGVSEPDNPEVGAQFASSSVDDVRLKGETKTMVGVLSPSDAVDNHMLDERTSGGDADNQREASFALCNSAFHTLMASGFTKENSPGYESQLFSSVRAHSIPDETLTGKDLDIYWRNKYFGMMEDVENLLPRVRHALANKIYTEWLLADAALGGDATDLIKQILSLSKSALQVDWRALPGQILGRIAPSLEETSEDARRLVVSAVKWLEENKGSMYSKVTLPNRHFSGLIRVGEELRRMFRLFVPVYAVLPLGGYETPVETPANRILVAAWDGSLRVLDADRGLEKSRLDLSPSPLLCFDQEDASRIICGSSNGTVFFVSCDARGVMQVEGCAVEAHKGRVNSVKIASGSKTRCFAWSAGDDGCLLQWDWATRQVQRRVESAHSSSAAILCIAVRNRFLATGGADRCVNVYSLETIVELESVGDGPTESPGVAQTTEQGEVSVKSLPLGRIAVLSGHGGEVTSIAMSLDERCICSGSADKTINIYVRNDGHGEWTCQRTLAGVHFSAVTSLCLSDDLILSTSDKIRVFNVSTGTVLKTWRCEGHNSVSASFMRGPSGPANAVCAASDDHLVRVWVLPDISPADRVKVSDQNEKDHALAVTGVSVDLQGKRACTSSLDKTCRVWSTVEGKCEIVLNGHTDSVYCCSMARDGSLCATGGLDRTCRLWDIARIQGRGPTKVLPHREVVFAVFLSDILTGHDDLIALPDSDLDSDSESPPSLQPPVQALDRVVVTGSYDGAQVFSVSDGKKREDYFVRQSLFDVPVLAAVEVLVPLTGSKELTVPGFEDHAIGFTPDSQPDELKRVGDFVFGPVENSFALWTIQ